MDPSERELAAIDWEALRRSAVRMLALRMRGLSTEDVEDASQEVARRYATFVRRNGPPHTPDGLLADLCRKVAANAIRKIQEERGLLAQLHAAQNDEQESEADSAQALRDYQTIVFFVREYFALRRAQCTTIAEAKAAGESLKALAARLKLSYEKVRQDWSRCVRLIHEAMRRNRLRLPWPVPRRRKRGAR
ncbi:MAG: hypothetical protein ABL977_05180 [Candidatus Eisenbacteria bacterium]